MTASSIVNMELELSLPQQNQFNLCTCKVRKSHYSMLFRFHLSHARSSKKGSSSSSQTITLAGNFQVTPFQTYSVMHTCFVPVNIIHVSMPICHFENKISQPKVQYNIAVGIHIFPPMDTPGFRGLSLLRSNLQKKNFHRCRSRGRSNPQ